MKSHRTFLGAHGARARFAAALATGLFSIHASIAQAIDIDGVQPAAVDQPQINAAVFVGANVLPQTATVDTFDWDTFSNSGTGTVFNISAYLDTGASGILLSTPTSTTFNLPLSSITYQDVGVAGSDNFSVSTDVRLAIANYYYNQTNIDTFDAQNHPITSTYTFINNGDPIRLQIGPQVHTIQDPNTQDPSIGDTGDLINQLQQALGGGDLGSPFDEIDQLIAELNAVDVVGMPAMKGKVVVIDPTRSANIGDFLNNIDTLNELPDMFVHTYVYAPNTPFNAATKDTDPGIPVTGHHIKLSYASFDRFTQLSPADPTGLTGPTLTHNPFIGQNPVALLFPNDPNNPATPGVPGIKITRKVGDTIYTSEGNWLLDTGAAASMISIAQAANLHVHYKAGTFGVDGVIPDLVDDQGADLPNQFTLAIQGIGGQITLAGFELDTLLLRDMLGDPNNDDDPLHIRFLHAPVLVNDISLFDPVSQKTLTLDGIFGMNFLMGSTPLDQSNPDDPTMGLDPVPGAFDWVTFDEPNGILGLNIDPNIGLDTTVPEPASLSLLGAVASILLLRRTNRTRGVSKA